MIGQWLKDHRPGSRPIVPVLRLEGAIGTVALRGRGLTFAAMEPAIERAFAHKRAPAVALVVNSPGGSPVQSALIAGRIRALAEEKEKPVLAFVEDVAASGGYWLALAADEIFVDPSSIIGSIGVVSAGFGFTEAIAKLGIERRVHTTGPKKALLDPFRPESEDDILLLRELQGDIFAHFKTHVQARRGDRLKPGEGELFNGRVWAGSRAVELGLVDGIGDLRSVLRGRFGKRVRPTLVNRPRAWWQRRLGVEEIAAALEQRLLFHRFGL